MASFAQSDENNKRGGLSSKDLLTIHSDGSSNFYSWIEMVTDVITAKFPQFVEVLLLPEVPKKFTEKNILTKAEEDKLSSLEIQET